ncbi:hypothetical protein [Scytonema sp. NUACC21]
MSILDGRAQNHPKDRDTMLSGLEQYRRDLDSAFGAIKELARTLEAFESRRRKRS